MLIDSKIIFKSKQARNGNVAAMCEMTDFHAAKDNWIESCSFIEKLVETSPSKCEKLFYDITKEKLSYEKMLLLIAWNYYHDHDNDQLAFRWFQKYFDYIDFKYSKLDDSARDTLKNECSMYQYMADHAILNRNEYRFWLKWEREHFNNSEPK